jgi:hypothetical protein
MVWLGALALALALAAPASATFPGDNGRIAFVAMPDSSTSSYVGPGDRAKRCERVVR